MAELFRRTDEGKLPVLPAPWVPPSGEGGISVRIPLIVTDDSGRT